MLAHVKIKYRPQKAAKDFGSSQNSSFTIFFLNSMDLTPLIRSQPQSGFLEVTVANMNERKNEL